MRSLALVFTVFLDDSKHYKKLSNLREKTPSLREEGLSISLQKIKPYNYMSENLLQLYNLMSFFPKEGEVLEGVMNLTYSNDVADGIGCRRNQITRGK